MKKLFFLLLAFFLPWTAHAKVKIVATLPVFAALAQEVGGDQVTVTNLARANQDPHFLDAKPSYVVDLNHADLLIFGGLDLEIGWLPPILTQARNSKILPGNPGNVNSAQGLHVLELPKVPMDRSFGDVHPLGNPHTWLDPRNAKLIAANIYQHLSQIDPPNEAYYKDRLKSFLGRLDQKLAEWQPSLQKLQGKKIVTYHKSFNYFADWTGLDVVDSVESKPGIPPSSKHVDELIQMIPREGVRAILMEDFYPKKVPEFLAQKANIPLLIVPTQTGDPGLQTYFELIDYLIAAVTKAVG